MQLCANGIFSDDGYFSRCYQTPCRVTTVFETASSDSVRYMFCLPFQCFYRPLLTVYVLVPLAVAQKLPISYQTKIRSNHNTINLPNYKSLQKITKVELQYH